MKNISLVAILAFLFVGTVSAQNLAQLDKSEYTKLANSDSQVEYYADNSEYKVDNTGKVSARVLSFHENGSVAETGVLVDDKQNGTWKKYNEEGTLLTEANFIDGQKDGIWKVWDENGTLRLEFSYDNGKRVGTWVMNDESGNLINTKEY